MEGRDDAINVERKKTLVKETVDYIISQGLDGGRTYVNITQDMTKFCTLSTLLKVIHSLHSRGVACKYKHLDTRNEEIRNFIERLYDSKIREDTNIIYKESESDLKGYNTTPRRYGYKVSYNPNIPRAILIPNLIEQECINRIITLRYFSSSKTCAPISYRKVIKIIEEEGFLPKYSDTWYPHTIKKLIDREYQVRMTIHKQSLFTREEIILFIDTLTPFSVPIHEIKNYIEFGIYNGKYEGTDHYVLVRRDKEMESQRPRKKSIECKTHKESVEETKIVREPPKVNDIRKLKLQHKIHILKGMKENPSYTGEDDVEALELEAFILQLELGECETARKNHHD